MPKVYDRARFVYRVNRINYFRCLLCGAIHPAATISRHVARWHKPAQETADDKPAIRSPYRDD